jgi:DNA-binding response OmpR family regulator
MAKLLVMEDDLVLGYELERKLVRAGHEVEVRRSASDAMVELLSTPYDLLITDVVVWEQGKPVPDGGITLMGRIRQTSEIKTLPVIAMTGAHVSPGMQDVLATMELVGANASLEKPFDIHDLLSHIERLIELHKGRGHDTIRP